MINTDEITQMGYFSIMTTDNFIILKHPTVEHYVAADPYGAKEVVLEKVLNLPIVSKFRDDFMPGCQYWGKLDNTSRKQENDNWWATFAWFKIK